MSRFSRHTASVNRFRLRLRPSLCGARPKLCRRLHDTRGFTLAEQLISIVFLGLLCVVIAVGLNTAFQSYRLANESTRANELLTRAVEEVGDELAFASSVEVTGAGPTFVSPTTKQPVAIGNDADGSGIVLVSQNAGDDSAFDPVLLVASSHGLTVEVFDVAFNDDKTDIGKKNTWDFRIDIKQQGRDTVIASTAMTVAWIG